MSEKILGIETDSSLLNFYKNEDGSIAIHSLSKIRCEATVISLINRGQAEQLRLFLEEYLK